MKSYGKYQITFVLFVLIGLCLTINDHYEKLDLIEKQKPIEVAVESKKCRESIFRKKTRCVSVIYFNVNGIQDSIYTNFKECDEIHNKIMIIKRDNEYVILNEVFTSKRPIYFIGIILLISIIPFKLFIRNKKTDK